MLIRSDALEVSVLPDVGGKIAQVRDRLDGHEWLVSPQRPYRTLLPGTQWIEYDTSGMDDCFPNVDECRYPSDPWRGVALPQLGEWVYGTWDVVEHAADRVGLRRMGEALPYRAFKQVCVDGRRVEVRYRVENPTDFPMRYLWSAHPLLMAGPDFELQLATNDDASFVTYPPDGKIYRWPYYGDVDLRREWIESGRTLKIFVSGLQSGSCSLKVNGRRVDFGFDVDTAPVLGLWFNNFGFPRGERTPFRCIAVEPCTSASDVLHADDALIAPQSDREWSISMRFD